MDRRDSLRVIIRQQLREVKEESDRALLEWNPLDPFGKKKKAADAQAATDKATADKTASEAEETKLVETTFSQIEAILGSYKGVTQQKRSGPVSATVEENKSTNHLYINVPFVKEGPQVGTGYKATAADKLYADLKEKMSRNGWYQNPHGLGAMTYELPDRRRAAILLSQSPNGPNMVTYSFWIGITS